MPILYTETALFSAYWCVYFRDVVVFVSLSGICSSRTLYTPD